MASEALSFPALHKVRILLGALKELLSLSGDPPCAPKSADGAPAHISRSRNVSEGYRWGLNINQYHGPTYLKQLWYHVISNTSRNDIGHSFAGMYIRPVNLKLSVRPRLALSLLEELKLLHSGALETRHGLMQRPKSSQSPKGKHSIAWPRFGLWALRHRRGGRLSLLGLCTA